MRIKLIADSNCRMSIDPIKLEDVDGNKAIMHLYNKICNYVQVYYPEFQLVPSGVSATFLSLAPCQAVLDKVAEYVDHHEEGEEFPYPIKKDDLDRLGQDLVKTFGLQHGNDNADLQIHWSMEQAPIDFEGYGFFLAIEIFPKGYYGHVSSKEDSTETDTPKK